MAAIHFSSSNGSIRGPGALIVPVIFALVGLGLLFGSLNMMARAWDFGRRGLALTGKVLDISTERVKDSHGEYKNRRYALIEFRSASGTPVRLREQSSSLLTGQKVDGLYLPERPDDISLAGAGSRYGAGLVMLVFGLLLTGVGGATGLHVLKRQAEIKWLLQSGRRVQAVVSGVNSMRHHNKKGPDRRSWQLICRWNDPRTGKTVSFKSEHLYRDPGDITGSQIAVLIDPSRPERYYVDTDALPGS